MTSSSIDTHTFTFDDADLCHIHNHFHLLAEIGGVQSLAAALRTDVKNGLLKDEGEKGFEKRRTIYGDNVYPTKALERMVGLRL